MLFENKEKGEFGITLAALRSLFPTISIPDSVDNLLGYTKYSPTIPPTRAYSKAVEVQPKDGTQQWKLEWMYPKEQLAQILQTEIDNYVDEKTRAYKRFRDEYVMREEEAKAYAASNFTLAPGPLLAGFAAKAGVDTKTATQTILRQSEGLRQLEVAIGDLRMAKYTIKPTDDHETQIATANGIKSQIDHIVAQVPK